MELGRASELPMQPAEAAPRVAPKILGQELEAGRSQVQAFHQADSAQKGAKESLKTKKIEKIDFKPFSKITPFTRLLSKQFQ